MTTKRAPGIPPIPFGGRGGLADHEASPDPHPQYQKEAEKGEADGYASLDASALVPVSQLPAATTAAAGAVVLATPSSDTTAGHAVQASDARLADARAPTGAAGGDLSGTYPNPTLAAGTTVTASMHAQIMSRISIGV